MTVSNSDVSKNGPIFEYHPINVDEEIVGEFAPILRIWRSRCYMEDGELKVPAWSDFKASDFNQWHANIARSIAEPSRDDIRFQYQGTTMMQFVGRDYTGYRFQDLVKPDLLSFFHAHWTRFLSKPMIALGYLQSPVGRDGFRPIEVINFPIMSEDRSEIAQVLHCVRRVREEDYEFFRRNPNQTPVYNYSS